jgi:hypothetical protein
MLWEVLTLTISASDSLMVPPLPRLSLMCPLKVPTKPFLTSITAPALTASMFLSQSVMRTLPVSSPTRASATLWDEPSLPITLLGSPTLTTFTVMLSTLAPGARSLTCTPDHLIAEAPRAF